MAEFLVGLTGFRNILVHLYTEIDRELEERAFEEIRRAMPKLLEKLRKHSEGDPCVDEIADKLRRAAGNLGIRYAVLFGSLAKNRCGRDVDIFVKLGRKPRSMIEVGYLKTMLEELLGADVDLIILEAGIDPGIIKTIIDEGIVVYGDREEAERDLLKLYKQALDYKYLLEKLNGEQKYGKAG